MTLHEFLKCTYPYKIIEVYVQQGETYVNTTDELLENSKDLDRIVVTIDIRENHLYVIVT